MSRRVAPLSLAALLGALLTGGCAGLEDAATGGLYCSSDDECGAPFICVFGACYDPASASLQQISLEVAPAAASNLTVQQFGDFVISGHNRSEIALSPTVHAHFRVNDATGGALAALVTAETPGVIPGRALRVDQRSDSGGAVVLNLTSGRPYALRVAPEDGDVVPFRPPSVFANDDLDGAQNATTLAPPAAETLIALRGRAVVATANPVGIPDLRVQVRALVGTPPERRIVSSTALTSNRAEDKGAFEVWLPADVNSDLQLRIAPTSANPFFPVVEIDGLDISGDTDLGPVEIGDVGTPLELHGLLSGPDGPVIGAALTFTGVVGHGVYAASTVSGSDGRYTINLLPGQYQAVAVPPATSTAALTQLLEPQLVDQPPGVTEINLTALARPWLRGTVLDADGTPLPGATLRASRVGNAPDSPPGPGGEISSVFETRSDLNGSYQLQVDPGLFEVTVIPPRDVLAPRRTDLVAVGLIDVDRLVQLYPPAPFGVRVQTATGGEALVGALVRAYLVLEDQRTVLVGEELTSDSGDFAMVLPSFGGSSSGALP